MIRALLLAAGCARRFGGTQKLVAPVPGRASGGDVALVRLATEALLASSIDEVIVVVGRDAHLVRETIQGLPVRVVMNAAYETGLSSSLRTGVEAAMPLEPHVTGLLVALADQPITDPAIVDAVVAAFRKASDGGRANGSIVVPRYAGVRGHPVIFGRGLVGELMAVTGDRGGREVVERDPQRVHYVDFPFEPPLDVDTEQDLAALRGRLARGLRDAGDRVRDA